MTKVRSSSFWGAASERPAIDSGSSTRRRRISPKRASHPGQEAAIAQVADEARAIDPTDHAAPIDPVGVCQKSGINQDGDSMRGPTRGPSKISAAEAELATWPPSSPQVAVARTTIASPFQRMIAVIRVSVSMFLVRWAAAIVRVFP